MKKLQTVLPFSGVSASGGGENAQSQGEDPGKGKRETHQTWEGSQSWGTCSCPPLVRLGGEKSCSR